MVLIVTAYHDEGGAASGQGHTDSMGDAEQNKQLSQQRAEAVRAYLVGKGVDASRLEAPVSRPSPPRRCRGGERGTSTA